MAEDNTAQARAAHRDGQLTTRLARLEILTAAQTDRWRTPKDILDD